MRFIYSFFRIVGFILALNIVLANGVTINEVQTTFTLRAPDAESVQLVLFNNHDDIQGEYHPMIEIEKGDYQLTIMGNLIGKYYGYEVKNRDPNTQEFSPNTLIADPYSVAVATQNHYSPDNKSLIYKNEFDWEGDGWLTIPHRDLIIYEAHLKDMTAHPSSNCTQPGTYSGFHELSQKGGIQHLKEMGYNAVEFLPLFEFGNVEMPYLDSTQAVINTWNPYEANHWGYMPSFFFAPEGNYASDADLLPGAWNGTSGKQVEEFKELVKALHGEGIAVILDVVYNHVSQYDNHPLKQLQKNEYFHRNDKGGYSSVSGCGNDLATENEDMREMIIASVLYWMEKYHIDGFRFDLGKLLDWQTIEDIIQEAKKVNPHIFITCEPWGGGYDPDGFSDRGWSSWNDQFRNAFKGWHPDGNGGFLFGKWHQDYDHDKIQRMFMGSPHSHGGQYLNAAHSLNYLESHDDHTLGDFIRIETGLVSPDKIIEDIDKHGKLTDNEIAIHKLAAMALMTSQGPVMIAQGQEWGRSKVIAHTTAADAHVGKMDHNSYEKDNETNWLNWEHKDANNELVEFYKSLIRIRKENDLLRNADPNNFRFLIPDKESVAVAFSISKKGNEIAVLMNSSQSETISFDINAADWESLISTRDGLALGSDSIQLPPVSGVILKR